MKSLRDIVESSPHLRTTAMHGLRLEDQPQPLGPALWDWADVRSVLLIRLRSIGDTVLATPSLFALKRFLRDVGARRAARLSSGRSHRYSGGGLGGSGLGRLSLC